MIPLGTFGKHIDFILLLIGSLFVIPFLVFPYTVDPYLTPQFLVWSILTFILFGTICARHILGPNRLIPASTKRILFPLYFGYFLFALLSLTQATNAAEGVYEVLKIFVSLVFLFVCVILFSRHPDYKFIFIKCITLTAFLLTLIGLYHYFTIAYGKSGIDILVSVRGTIGHKNLLSSAILLTFPFCLYCFFSFHIFWRIFSGLTAAMSLTLILLLQARAVWLAGVLSCACVFVLVLFLRKEFAFSKKYTLRFLAPLILILVICAGSAWYFASKSDALEYLTQRTNPSTLFSKGTGFERMLIWKKSFLGIRDRPLLGHGAGNWRITLPSYGLQNLTQRSFKYVYFQRPHNDFIWVLYETGIFGFLFYVSIFAVAFIYLIKTLRSHSQLSCRYFALCLFSALIAYIVVASFSFPKERIFHSIMLLFILAIIITLYNESRPSRPHLVGPAFTAVSILSLVPLIMAILIGYCRFRSEILTKQAYEARNRYDYPQVIDKIDKAYSPFAALDPVSAPLQWYKGEAHYLMGNYREALVDYKMAYEAHPYHIHVLNNLATCYEELQDHDRAIFYYQKALSIFPEFEETLINLGATYYNSGRYELAYQTLIQCNPRSENPKLKLYLETVKKELDTSK